MSDPSRTRRRTRDATRRRRAILAPAALAGAILAALFLLPGGLGTGANWTSGAQAELGEITGGSLDLVWNAEADDELALTALGLPDMLPGDSRAVTIDVTSEGTDAPLEYDVRARATNPAFDGALSLQVFAGGTATNGGSFAAGYTSSCSGTALGGAQPLTTTDTPAASVPGPIEPGSAHTLCVRVAFSGSAPAALKGLSTQVVLTALARSEER